MAYTVQKWKWKNGDRKGCMDGTCLGCTETEGDRLIDVLEEGPGRQR